jgi:hypothetical protein
MVHLVTPGRPSHPRNGPQEHALFRVKLTLPYRIGMVGCKIADSPGLLVACAVFGEKKDSSGEEWPTGRRTDSFPHPTSAAFWVASSGLSPDSRTVADFKPCRARTSHIRTTRANPGARVKDLHPLVRRQGLCRLCCKAKVGARFSPRCYAVPRAHSVQ